MKQSKITPSDTDIVDLANSLTRIDHTTNPPKQAWSPKENEMPRGRKYIVVLLAAGTVLALIVACAALAITVAISQTELKFLQQQINELRETLNQTDSKQASEIKQLQQKLDDSTDTIKELANRVSTLEENTQTLDGKISCCQ